jgi:hypothetical protein
VSGAGDPAVGKPLSPVPPFAEIPAPPARGHCNASGSSLNNSRRRTVYRSGSFPRFSCFIPARFPVFRKSDTTGRFPGAAVPVFPRGISWGSGITLRRSKTSPSDTGDTVPGPGLMDIWPGKKTGNNFPAAFTRSSQRFPAVSRYNRSPRAHWG